MNDADANYNELLEMIEVCYQSPEDVVRLFINWHGTRLLTDDFIENTREELGYND